MNQEEKYKITQNTWNKVADLYLQKFMNLKIYDQGYELFCQFLKGEKPRVLEIGCGPGNISRYLLNKHPGIVMECTDVSFAMVALAKMNVTNAKVYQMDAREISGINRSFNGIVCGFCIPYLALDDVLQLFKDSYRLLEKGGLLYYSFIEGNYERSGLETGSSGDGAYVYYYGKNNLFSSCREIGFSLLHEEEIQYGDSSHSSSRHLICIFRK